MKLIIATKNAGKLAEFRALLAGLPFEVESLADYPQIADIDETGETFAENAAIKAETVSRIAGELALADDSGLEVDALDGNPGVHSARYAGLGAGDEANNKKLLAQLANVPAENRTARFRAVIAVSQPGRATQFAHGVCEGNITFTVQGENGFGYDPLFVVLETNKTFAQMSAEQKNKISHRAHAMGKAADILKNISITG